MLQHLIVAMIVMAAALYSGWSLMPAGARRNAAARLAARAARWGLGHARAQELERSLASSSGCSDCSSCKACDTGRGATAPGSAPATAVIAMPVSRRSQR